MFAEFVSRDVMYPPCMWLCIHPVCGYSRSCLCDNDFNDYDFIYILSNMQ